MRQDLRQKDFSNLAIADMSPAERAELLRRYSHFVEHFRMDDPPAAPAKPVRKWIPGAQK